MSKLIQLAKSYDQTTLAIDPNEIACVGTDADVNKTFIILQGGAKLYINNVSVDKLMKTINSYRE